MTAAKQKGSELDRDLVVKNFAGMNTQAARTAIAEEEFSWLENVMPIGHANLKVVGFQGAPVAMIPGVTINYFSYVNINNTDYEIAATSTGALYAINLGTFVVTAIAPAGTLTGSVAVTQWKNERALIIAGNGYFNWDGTIFSGNGSVAEVDVTAAGTGYTSLPAVGFTGGGGTGLAANVSGMLAISATISAGGSNYAVGDVLKVVGGTQTAQAEFQVATLSGSAVATVTLLQAGNYTVLPSNPAATTSSVGTGATLTVAWGVLSVKVTNSGTGYIAAPIVAFTGGGGSAAAATAQVILGPTAGSFIVTYAGRVWIANARTVSFTAPNSYFDFNVADSAGSFVITDETLQSNITGMVTANNFLYIFGAASINVISNVTLGSGSPVPTLFSNTNVSALIGSTLPLSIFPYYRAIGFATKYGFYAVVGATPEKISDHMDGIIPLIDFTKPVSGGVANIFDILCMAWQFSYKDPLLGSSRPLLAIYFNKKWFVASQGPNLSIIGSGFQSGTPSLFGTDGQNIYQLFSDAVSSINTTVQTPLWHMKAPTRMKEAQKSGVELTTSVGTATVTMTLDSDFGSIPITFSGSSVGQWVNAAGTLGNWANAAMVEGEWVATGFEIFQGDSEAKGRYLGYTLTSTTPAYALNGFLMQYQISTPWATKANL